MRHSDFTLCWNNKRLHALLEAHLSITHNVNGRRKTHNSLLGIGWSMYVNISNYPIDNSMSWNHFDPRYSIFVLHCFLYYIIDKTNCVPLFFLLKILSQLDQLHGLIVELFAASTVSLGKNRFMKHRKRVSSWELTQRELSERGLARGSTYVGTVTSMEN